MEDFRSPPPYSETDVVYSNTDSRSPLSPTPNLSRSTTLADDASQRSSIIYTPPYTPTDALQGDFNTSSARLYFESRPLLHRARSGTFSHEITIKPDSKPDDLPYLPEFADRDITTQDWATFVNYVIPHHIDVSNGLVANEKMKAEVLDERMRRLTLDAPRDMSALDAQLNNLQPSQLDLSNPQASDLAAIVDEWNAGFFDPRGVHIMASVLVPDPPVVLPEAVTEEEPRPRGWQADRSCARPCFEASWGGRESRGRVWGLHGPGHRGAYGRGGRCGGFGQNPPGEFFGPHDPRRGFFGTDNNGFHLGRIMSAEKDSFRLGPMVADKSGFRIGNMLVANEEGLKVGGMYFKNSRHPDTPQGNTSPVERGRTAARDDAEAAKNRQRSSSVSSASSDETTATEESEGSLPDAADLKASQLPLMKQSLLAWLDHPDQPVSKASIRNLKHDLKNAKSARKLEGQELVDLKAEIKALMKTFREIKKSRRALRKAMMKERRKERKEARAWRKEERRGAKAARKRERKGKGRQEPPAGPRSEPGHVGFIPPIPYPPAVPRGLPQMPHTPHWPRMPSVPRMPGSFPGAESDPRTHGMSRSAEELAEIQSNRARLEAEAAQILAGAQATHEHAEQMRKRAHEQQDEKMTLKLLDAARELDSEAEKLFEEADRLVAEAAQLEEYAMEMERNRGGVGEGRRAIT